MEELERTKEMLKNEPTPRRRIIVKRQHSQRLHVLITVLMSVVAAVAVVAAAATAEFIGPLFSQRGQHRKEVARRNFHSGYYGKLQLIKLQGDIPKRLINYELRTMGNDWFFSGTFVGSLDVRLAVRYQADLSLGPKFRPDATGAQVSRFRLGILLCLHGAIFLPDTQHSQQQQQQQCLLLVLKCQVAGGSSYAQNA